MQHVAFALWGCAAPKISQLNVMLAVGMRVELGALCTEESTYLEMVRRTCVAHTHIQAHVCLDRL